MASGGAGTRLAFCGGMLDVFVPPQRLAIWFALVLPLAAAAPADAGTLCDPSTTNCRTQLITLIRNERVGIDVAFWFMQDARYANELVYRRNAGVPIRVLMDTRANADYPGNDQNIATLKNAGIPLRRRTASGILHWKMMLFAGQNTVEFGSANYSPDAFVPAVPRTNYVAESIYFTSDAGIVNSFKTKFDDCWMDTTNFANYANVSSRTRTYPTYPIDSRLNFPPSQSFVTRSVNAYNAETRQIDAIMFRITDRRHADALIKARQRGVPIRLIVDNGEYRTAQYLWDSWNTDRLYAAGVSIRWRGHAGENHEKLVLLHAEQQTIFGSSNWTSASTSSQLEHNMFTTNSSFFSWFLSQFERMWGNLTGATETVAFKPLPPDVPSRPSPATGSAVTGSTVTLRWYGGPWAHTYDVYIGTSSAPPRIASNVELGPSSNTSQKQSFAIQGLAAGRTYYWKVVSKTAANKTATSPLWSFSAGS